ncbi:MAG: hypothetical protein GSR75_02245 [Desulfurococcales archaeon]|nr:hypothetical protein [Desulfurococcales archaeon]
MPETGNPVVEDGFTGVLRVMCKESILLAEAVYYKGSVICAFSVDEEGGFSHGDDAVSRIVEVLSTQPGSCVTEVTEVAAGTSEAVESLGVKLIRGSTVEAQKHTYIPAEPLKTIEATEILLRARYLRDTAGVLADIVKEAPRGSYLSCRDEEGREIRMIVGDTIRSTLRPLPADLNVECKLYALPKRPR